MRRVKPVYIFRKLTEDTTTCDSLNKDKTFIRRTFSDTGIVEVFI